MYTQCHVYVPPYASNNCLCASQLAPAFFFYREQRQAEFGTPGQGRWVNCALYITQFNYHTMKNQAW